MITEFSNNGTANGIFTLLSTAVNYYKTSAYVWVLQTNPNTAIQTIASELISELKTRKILLFTTELFSDRITLLLVCWLPTELLTTYSSKTTFCLATK